MNAPSLRRPALAVGLALVGGFFACAEPPAPATAPIHPPAGSNRTSTSGYVDLCKKTGVAGTYYTFYVSVNGGAPKTFQLQPSMDAANCVGVYGADYPSNVTVSITEDLSNGAVLNKIEYIGDPAATSINGPTITFTVNTGSYFMANYYNGTDGSVCTDPNATNYGGALPCTYPPQVCTDPSATNYGGPLPCVYPTPPCPAGSFTFNYDVNGDLHIVYDQFPAPNDNSYGANAVGWPNGHKFSDLVGSDHAGFMLVDPGGVTRLSFNVDYISANTAAPSGYASLGVLGGDGKMLVGTSSGITATTSLANNLNNINIPGLFNAAHVQQFGSVNLFVDSPPTDAAHLTYAISDPTLAGWDFHDTYFVTISAAKLASLGFDRTTWQVLPNASQLHNSPAKPCPTTSQDGISVTKYEAKDKQVKITLTNSSSVDQYVTALTLDWPSLVNGKLMQVKLDGDVFYSGPSITSGPISLGVTDFVTDPNKRKINHGSSDVYTLVFEKNVDTNLSHYSGTVTVGSTTLTVLPH